MRVVLVRECVYEVGLAPWACLSSFVCPSIYRWEEQHFDLICFCFALLACLCLFLKGMANSCDDEDRKERSEGRGPGSVHINDGGEGCIGLLQAVDVNKQIMGERSNSMYILGVCLAFFASSAKGGGEVKNAR